jgi:hypothetical protein
MRCGVARGGAVADRLAVVVHGDGLAVAAEGAEVDHPTSLRPRERVLGVAASACDVAVSDHLAAGVDRGGLAVGAAEGAEIPLPPMMDGGSEPTAKKSRSKKVEPAADLTDDVIAENAKLLGLEVQA